MVVEDEALVAMDLEQRLKRLGYGVSGIYGDYEKAINYLEIHTPEIILCDISIRGEKDGIDIAEYVHKHKSIPFIFVTALSDRATLDRAKKTLPYGYIVKPYENSDLVSAIEMALYKHSAEIDQSSMTIEKISSLCNDPISEREYEIVQDILNGLNNAQIAESRFISINTTKFHVSNIFSKMGVKSRTNVFRKILSLYA